MAMPVRDRDGGDEEVAYRIDDKDDEATTDLDPCDKCYCAREEHEGGTGECSCGRCKGFKEAR